MRTIGVIGLGSIGMRHAKNLRDMGHHVWGYDPDMKRRLELGFEFGVSRIEHLATADALVIASPTPMHAEHLTTLADFNKPIFVEKPIFGVDPEFPDEMQNIDFTNVLMVGYNLRFHSCVKRAKAWLDAGLIGKPLWSNFTLGQYSEKTPYLRDGVTLNWSHEIDLCTYLLGPAGVAASSTRLTDGKDDMTDILLTHNNGCRSTVHLDYLTKSEQRYFSITGESGTISANIVNRSITIDSHREAGSNVYFDTWNDNYIEEMQAFLDRIDGKETIGCTGQEGLEVLKICLEVRKQAGLE